MFKTQLEMIKALSDGLKIKYETWSLGEFAEMNDGFIVNERGELANISFSSPNKWSIVEKPKPPRKLYAYSVDGDEVRFSHGQLVTVNYAQKFKRLPEFDIIYED